MGGAFSFVISAAYAIFSVRCVDTFASSPSNSITKSNICFLPACHGSHLHATVHTHRHRHRHTQTHTQTHTLYINIYVYKKCIMARRMLMLLKAACTSTGLKLLLKASCTSTRRMLLKASCTSTRHLRAAYAA